MTSALCQRCRLRPRAFTSVRTCFECWPGGAVAPPPCLRCGSTGGYWTAGLCEDCHPRAPRRPAPCRDCLAWGVHRGNARICRACEWWRRHRDVDSCGGCARTLAVGRDGRCRLCQVQHSSLIKRTTADGRQLFFAGWFRPASGGAHSQASRAPLRHASIRPVTHRQLVLLEVPADMESGLRLGFPPPQDPELSAALWEAAGDHGARHGWSRAVTERVRRGVRIMLGLQHTPGAPIRTSDVALLAPIRMSASGVAAVLREAGMLEDDSVPAVVRWFPIFTAELPAEMQAELVVWFDVRRHGSRVAPRSRPRHDRTVSSQLRFAMPALRAWARTHSSLREIAREDVYAVLPPSGSQRQTMLQGLRSIFRVLKSRRLVFVNPTTHLSAPHADRPAPLAVDLDALHAVLDGDDRVAAALAGLLAFHGVRVRQLVQARLTDVRDGRLYVGEQVILLAPAARDRLDAWLAERATRWPDTANPHLFLNYRNAGTTSAASPWWIRKRLGMSGQAIRMDRILDEAHATSGDLRRLCDLFGLSPAGAARYTTTVVGPRDGVAWQHAAGDAPYPGL